MTASFSINNTSNSNTKTISRTANVPGLMPDHVVKKSKKVRCSFILFLIYTYRCVCVDFTGFWSSCEWIKMFESQKYENCENKCIFWCAVLGLQRIIMIVLYTVICSYGIKLICLNLKCKQFWCG